MHRARRVQSGKTRQICPAYQAAPAVRPVPEPTPAPASRDPEVTAPRSRPRRSVQIAAHGPAERSRRWRMINRLSSRLRGSGPVRPTNRQAVVVSQVFALSLSTRVWAGALVRIGPRRRCCTGEISGRRAGGLLGRRRRRSCCRGLTRAREEAVDGAANLRRQRGA